MELISEPRKTLVGRVRGWVVRRAHLVLPIAACVTILVSTAGIWPGAMHTGDAIYHLGNAQDVANALRLGQDPLARLPQQIGTPTFRFYQPLHALATGFMHALTGLPLETWFTFFTIIPFALSPFAYLYMMRCVGLGRWPAAVAAFAGITTVLGFSNSMLGLVSGGIVTQAPAALFFPLFVGKFVRVLRGERGVLAAGLFFALTTVSHAAFAMYALIAAALATVVLWPRSGGALARAAAVGCFGVLLAAFWLVPFLSYQAEHRPIPDSIFRFDRTIWFTGLSGRELGQLVATGRFFDGERDVERGSDDELDTRIRNLNIFGLQTIRPPVLSVLMGLAVLVALLRIRHGPVRFLLCLFMAGFLLVLGLDDIRVMARLPFMRQMQGFRATYLIDQGGFGLLGIALVSVVRPAIWVGRWLPRVVRWTLSSVCVVAVALAMVVASAWLFVHAARIAVPGAGPWRSAFHYHLDRHRARIGPFRIRGVYKAGTNQNRRNNLIHRIGYAVPCAHVAGIAGQTARSACEQLRSPAASMQLAELLGVGYFIVDKRQPHGIDKIEHDGRTGRYRRISAKRNLQLWESRKRSYIHAAQGPIVLVQANHAQWVLLVQAWLARYGSRATQPAVPIPVRMQSSDLHGGVWLDAAKAVVILDPQPRLRAPGALRAFADRGGLVYSVAPIAGIDARVLAHQEPWAAPFTALSPEPSRPEGDRFRMLASRSPGHELRFIVRLVQPGLLLVAESCFRNWTATLDGRPLSVRPAGPDLVSVLVPAGRHNLRLQWRTTWLELASYFVSALALAAAGVALAIWARRAWRRRGRRFRGPSTIRASAEVVT